MHTRLTTLETKWDTVIPTLATREDLLALEGRLRDDMRHGFVDLQRSMDASLQRWVLVVVAVVAITVGGGAGVMLSKRSAAAMSLSVEQPAETPQAAAAEAAVDAGHAAPQLNDRHPG